jgi:hypothetical protein
MPMGTGGKPDPSGQCPTTALLGDDPNLRLVPRVQVCVLEPLWSRVTQIEGPEAGQRPLVRAIGHHRWTTARKSASQQGMCSLDGRCVIERHDDQRFRWSAPIWSPPPESNRRPHPYHRCAAGSRRRAAPHVPTQPRRWEVLPTVESWGVARLRVAQFLANLWHATRPCAYGADGDG